MDNGKQGAQKVLRFPRTVMEAVYGLNTYLQNQFSALADIYMPIEGITESKPLQEFVYRLCPSTIKPKSFSLDRIYGKTLAWNQIIKSGMSDWDTNMSKSISGDTITLSSAAGSNNKISKDPFFGVAGHKYFVSLYYTSNKAVSLQNLGMNSLPAVNSFTRFVNVYTAASTGIYIYNYTAMTAGEWTIALKNFEYVDLTLLYGSAIDGMTDEQILAKFESEFPGYHDYSAGKLISNDAESIDTVGFNQWDEEWEIGAIYPGGSEDSTPTRIKTKNYIPVFENTDYYICFKNYTGILGTVIFYDANKKAIDSTAPGSGRIVTTPANTRFMRVSFYPNYGTTYNHDICINLSDPAKNGTYEPYRKSTMQLNLDSFQVRDSQGNVTTITGGLKSAGDVRDEIVGNKYIKRVGSVDLGSLAWSYGYGIFYSPEISDMVPISRNPNGICGKYSISTETYSNTPDKSILFGDSSFSVALNRVYINDSSYSDPTAFKAAMSGVMLYYELATPIEYELVSPLVPTVKAGTTEARISPNSDGLSAPMVADMTYDAHANNDSASSQYALTAGRLLNSHKLWGQDFDGTQDVTGELTGVNNLNSLLYLGSTNVGIGQSNPQYKLDVSGTARVTGNTTIGGTLGVTGATTLTGALTANGAVSINNTLTVGTSQTNRATTLNGTLTVSGATTLNGALNVSSTAKISNTLTLGSGAAYPSFFLNANAQSGLKIWGEDAATSYMLFKGGKLGINMTPTNTVDITGTLGVSGLTTIAGGVKLTTTKKIWFDDTHYIELLNGYLHTNLPIVSDSYITAGAANTNA